jgi:hypothetical protein
MIDHTTNLCCLVGTLVNTPMGPIPIETLVLGEAVLFADGSIAHVSAVEHLSTTGSLSHQSPLPLPVLVRAGSAGQGMPRRDAFVFPESEMLQNGDIAHLRGVADQRSVLQIAGADRLQYVFAAFDAAGFPLAEGAAIRCTRTIEDVARLRDKLDGGERIVSTTKDDRPLAGGIVARLETCSREAVGGVAFDPADVAMPVRLQLVVDGIVAGGVTTGPRSILFQMDLPSIMRPAPNHVVQVRLADGGADIAGSPFLLSGTSWPSACGSLLTHDAQAAFVSDFDGLLGTVDRRRIEGFAWTPSQPETPETILVVDNGRVISTVLANLRRPDLSANRIGDGRHGFEVHIPAGLSPFEAHTIQILRASDGASLPGAPKTIPASHAFADIATQAVAEAVEAIATPAELDTALDFMTTQTSRLLQRRADLRGGQEARAAFTNFTRRWGPNPEASKGVPGEKPRLRLLIIVNSLPRSNSPYLSSQLRSHAQALVSLGYDVDVVAAGDIVNMPPRAAQIPMPGVTICEPPYYGSAEEVLRRHAGTLDVVYVLAADMGAFYVRLARRLNPRAKLVFSPGYFTFLELMERASLDGRPELSRFAVSRRVDELSAAAASDIVLTPSALDYALVKKELPSAMARLVPFCLPLRKSGVSLVDRAGIAFLAGRGDSLDFDSVHHLVDDIMPEIWKLRPDLECALVFSEVPGWAVRLARPGVTIYHRASEDGAIVLDRVALTIAPYRFHGGLSTAILESFAAGVPCLMTPVACAGIDLPAGLRQLMCRDASEFANRVAALSNSMLYDEVVTDIDRLIAQFDEDSIKRSLREAMT